ncbi:hypothetical protein [Frigoribacterium sp. PhB116]|uniref:hypothetical protein n=1 Tax=Frigoribacterium sp. PhB116 TaxID=2485174 RepID=UPI00105E6293|nr:hypothetical protein [Frigoribacterium sp. PhB116]TDT64444.1 hypothetical protein EDF20_1941 [Frigoribacterium sp. PhB116]
MTNHFPFAHQDIHLWVNKKWINHQAMQGRGIVDIGALDPALNPRGPGALPQSDFYDLEQPRVQGYPNYSQDPQPSWHLRP